MKRVMLTLLVLALIGAVAYLAGSINHSRYRLAQDGDVIIVERGYRLPFGFGHYQPESGNSPSAYSPIPLPEGVTFDSDEIYGERSDLDHAVFALLAAWAHSRLTVGGEKNLELASLYLERALLLPAISEDQRADLRRFRGQVAFSSALTRIDDMGIALRKARVELQLAAQTGVADAPTVDGLVLGLNQVEAAHKPLMAQVGSTARLGSLPRTPERQTPESSNHAGAAVAPSAGNVTPPAVEQNTE